MGDLGVEDIHLPPLYTSLPIFHALPRCILQGSPYRHTSPVERGNLCSSCPLLKLTLRFFFPRPFHCSSGLPSPLPQHRGACVFFLRDGERGIRTREREDGGAEPSRADEQTNREPESSHETSIAEENTNLILRVIHLGRHRSGLSAVICIFTSICFVLIVPAPRVLLLQRSK